MKALAGLILISLVGLMGCKVELQTGDKKAYNYNFDQGSLGWSAGFSGYPTNDSSSFQLESGIRILPNAVSGKGYYLSGNNRSGDLFMFLKHRLTGLEPSTRYFARLRLTFLSNASTGCVGIGGVPGDNVFLKFGFHQQEPEQVGYDLNADKGQHGKAGTQSVVLGNIAVPTADCSGSSFSSKVLQTTTAERLSLFSDDSGSVWVFVGTDSGYEGLTQIYYQEIELALEPL